LLLPANEALLAASQALIEVKNNRLYVCDSGQPGIEKVPQLAGGVRNIECELNHTRYDWELDGGQATGGR
jgi:hypothetical protein